MASPYDNIIDIATPEGLKLHFKIVKGLDEGVKFSGDKEDLAEWLEHIRTELVKFRLLPALSVVVARPTANTVELVNFFEDSGRVNSTQLAEHVANVWAPVVLPPIQRPIRNPDGLGGNAAQRRVRDLAHRAIMMQKSCQLGEMIFNSVQSKFQNELALEAETYQMTAPNGNVYDDGTALLGVIFAKVDPSTVVGVSNLKGLIEKADLADFNHSVPDMLTFFKRTKIKIESAGDRDYKEYQRLLYDALLTTQNKAFHNLTTISNAAHEEGKQVLTFAEIAMEANHRFNTLNSRGKWVQNLQDGGEIVQALKAEVTVLKERMKTLKAPQGATALKAETEKVAVPYVTLPTPRTEQKDGRKTLSIYDESRWKFAESGATKQFKGKTHHKCTRCGDRYGMGHMYVLHKEEDHKDLLQKRAGTSRGGDNKKSKLTVNEDLKVAMLACTTSDEVDALIAQFQAKE